MDAIAAQKAGMSYGKWKALHPHTGVEEPAVVQGPKRLCKICGQEIPEYRSKMALYCSEECKYKKYQESQRNHCRRYRERMMADGKV
jgi:predicted nucleic acid-binding Zn ribbon protein